MGQRLIDANSLVNEVRCDKIAYDKRRWSWEAIISLIDNQKSIDAVPVIRCKDCKYWWKANSLCTHNKHCDGNLCMHECMADDFCSDGERKIQSERSPHT